MNEELAVIIGSIIIWIFFLGGKLSPLSTLKWYKKLMFYIAISKEEKE
jgi:hypothetical protein